MIVAINGIESKSVAISISKSETPPTFYLFGSGSSLKCKMLASIGIDEKWNQSECHYATYLRIHYLLADQKCEKVSMVQEHSFTKAQ